MSENQQERRLMPENIRIALGLDKLGPKHKYHKTNERVKIHLNLEPPISPHWVIGERVPMGDKQRHWLVKCNYCDAETTRSTQHIKADNHRCPCRGGRRGGKIELAYEGQTKQLPGWKMIYPEINLTTSRNYFSRRTNGIKPYVNYTDAQILFGVAGCPKRGFSDAQMADMQAKEASKLTTDFRILAINAISKALTVVMEQHIEPTILELSRARTNDNFLVAGTYYPIECMMGETIGYYMDENTDRSEIVEYLRMESFSCYQDKLDKLGLFIPVYDDELRIVDMEIMALFSVVNISDL